MIEVGDMILYTDTKVDCNKDIGWVVHTERHHFDGGLANLIVIKWLVDDTVDSVWERYVEEHKEFTLVKGGQYER